MNATKPSPMVKYPSLQYIGPKPQKAEHKLGFFV